MFGETTASIVEAGMLAASRTAEGLGAAVDGAADTGVTISDAAVGFAVKRLLSTMHYACEKIRESGEDLPSGAKLIVTADAKIVSLSIEVPASEIRAEAERSETLKRLYRKTTTA